MENSGNLPAYKIGTLVKEKRIIDEFVYCVEYKNFPLGNAPGFWLSYENKYTSLTSAVDKFALLKKFKDPSLYEGLVIRKYRVKSPLKVREGTVGSLFDDDLSRRYLLKGGANQLEVMEKTNWFNSDPNVGWKKFLEKIENYEIILN